MSKDSDHGLNLPLVTPVTKPGDCADGCCAPATTTATASVDADRRVVLSHRVRLLVGATITYNIFEDLIRPKAVPPAGLPKDGTWCDQRFSMGCLVVEASFGL